MNLPFVVADEVVVTIGPFRECRMNLPPNI